MKLHLGLLILCFVAVHSKSDDPEAPPPPSVPIGPFDLTGNKGGFVSPPGDDKEGDYDRKGLFQGDIKDSGRRKTGGQIGEAGTRTPWPNGIIPYVFDCSVESIESAVKATKDAMAEWEGRTCVRFVKKQPHHKVYLEFIRAAGCWATYVGYKGKKTQISIGNGCDYKHVMVHELGHVIGFWHEQSRPDRDQYITINRGNVHKALLYNFDIVKEQVNNYGEPYDFDSIMHYPWNAFAIDRRQNTIFPINRQYLGSKRPYQKLSDSDVAQTNKMYQCNKIALARDASLKFINDETNVNNAASSPGGKCQDKNTNCPSWAKGNQCDLAPDPVIKTCPESCGICKKPCADDYDDCKAWAEYGNCFKAGDIKTVRFMLNYCRISCGVCNPDSTTKAPTKAKPATTIKPVTKEGECLDKHEHCASWAKADYCNLSPDPMLTTCPKSCGICDKKKDACTDGYKDCEGWAEGGLCNKKDDQRAVKFMMTNCKKSCRVCNPVPSKKPNKRPTTTLPPTTTLSPTTTLPPTTTPEPTTTAPTTVQIMTTPKSTTKTPTTKSGIRLPTGKFTGVLCNDRSKYCQSWANDGRCDTDRWVYDNCMLSCKRFSICDEKMIKPLGKCTDPLGVYSNKEIPDNKMYASSTFAPGGGWYAPASSGRLYKEDDHARKHVGAWCAAPYRKTNNYLQIDFGRKRSITALATQGRDTYFEHVKSYSLSFSDDRSTWREYKENGVKKVFDGNCDHVTPVLNLLENAEYARYIRIHPIKYIAAACLRVEVYGC